MPIYEYICRDCGHEFEKIVRASSGPVECVRCGAAAPERKVSLFAARVDGREVAGGSKKHCGTCSGGSCATCR